MAKVMQCAKCGYKYKADSNIKCPRCGSINSTCTGCMGNCLRCSTEYKKST